ncbi:DUF6207 family protein [Streptomyces sp. NPDC055692]|uniref:DUF6207 family protein n=1 Tax=Streptomyces sp. NPDC055692 TaxID=3155683 RepID=UPI00341430DE
MAAERAGTLLGRVKPPGSKNLVRCRRVVPCMEPINEAHVVEPGLAVVEVAACDDQTAFAVQELLATRWATATADFSRCRIRDGGRTASSPTPASSTAHGPTPLPHPLRCQPVLRHNRAAADGSARAT